MKLITRRVVLTVLSSFLRQSCLVFTNVTSALEVFLNVMRYINPRFTYLLTYLFIYLPLLESLTVTDGPALQFGRIRRNLFHLTELLTFISNPWYLYYRGKIVIAIVIVG